MVSEAGNRILSESKRSWFGLLFGVRKIHACVCFFVVRCSVPERVRTFDRFCAAFGVQAMLCSCSGGVKVQVLTEVRAAQRLMHMCVMSACVLSTCAARSDTFGIRTHTACASGTTRLKCPCKCGHHLFCERAFPDAFGWCLVRRAQERPM